MKVVSGINIEFLNWKLGNELGTGSSEVVQVELVKELFCKTVCL